MADQENINFGALGLNLETSISQVKKGQWTYALNAIAEGFDGQSVNLQNEPGSQSCIEFPEGFKVIGRRPVYEKNIIIWWLANPTTKESQIGWSDIDGCTYTKRIDPSCLNLSIEHPVLQSAHRISNCGLEIFWVDGYSPDRFINWDNLPYKEIPAVGQACGNTILPEIDCNKLNINPSFAIPKLDVIAVDSDGEIKSGTVQFAIQYSNANGEGYTSYYSITNPVSIFSISNVTLDFNATVAKSITLSISNLDTTGYYDYFNLAVINTVNGITTPSLVGTYQINKANETIVYTGQNLTQKALSLVEIAEKYPVYETSKIITTANDILIRADVKTVERLSYQEIANNIHLQWCRYRLPSVGFNDPLNVVNYKGYMSDEVYAFELVFQLAKGIETDGFHIPGRKYLPNDLTTVSNNDTNNVPLPQWKVYNTASKIAFKDEWLNSTKTNDYKGAYDFGEFAYWESVETYPCEEQYGELKGQPIRHHKFPDNTLIEINDTQENVYPLGVQIDVREIKQLIANSSLTQEQKDEIVGFKIIRGNRVNNKSIVAKGILRNVGQYEKDGTTYLFPNYPYNSTQPDPFISNTTYPEASKSRFTFQSPDTTFFQPTVSTGQLLKLESALYGTSQGHFQQVKSHSRYKLYTSSLYVTSMTLGIVIGFATSWYIEGAWAGTVEGGFSGAHIFDGTAAFTTYQTMVDILERTVPFVNYTYQYNSIGNYNNNKVIPNDGNKLRILDSNQYVIDGFANVNDVHTLNNYNRESSVYLKTNKTLPLPSDISGVPVDDSRYTLGETSRCNSSTEIVNKNINCYYGSIKKNSLQQYNQLYSYETVGTGFQVSFNQIDKQYYQVFGGDIFINKFSFKTKLRFFLDDGINKPDGADIFFNEIFNVGSPNYWYSASTNTGSERPSGLGFIGDKLKEFFGIKDANLDCESSQFFYKTGKMYLFAYGIPTFFCESEVNVDNRQAFNNKEGDFYPHVGTGIPDDWFQSINVPITYDNTYHYNRTYSKQNKENVFTHLPLGWVPSDCKTHLPYRAVFSEDRTNNPLSLERNNWLIYKPSSYFDFPQNFGKLTSLDGIENRQVLARFENKTLVYNALLTAPTSQAQVYLGQTLFSQQVPPIDLASTDQGFVGSRHKFLERTEYGIITVDDVRGQVFLLQGNKPKNLTGADSGVEQFFNKNLEVQLSKYFPGLPIDNAFNGVGITGVYDAKYNRLILTKLDYLPLNDKIKYDGRFYVEGASHEVKTTEPCCPDGFTLDSTKTLCTKSNKTLAIKDNTIAAFNVVEKQSSVYSNAGTRIYSVYTPNGIGISTLLTSSFWKSSSSITGPMNRCAIWNSISNLPTDKWVGVTVPINVTTDSKVVYIGCAGDNSVKIKIGCTNIINFGENTAPFTGGYNSPVSTAAFNYWHVYPITLPKGLNYVEIYGWNNDSIAGFGFEIYDNTEAELAAATSIGDLNILFTTASLIGQTLDNVKYSCPNCSSLVQEGDVYYCVSPDITTPVQSCASKSTLVTTKSYITLGDPLYFCNKSFTISYDFDMQSWVSFHSYTQNFYVGSSNFYISGINGSNATTFNHLLNNQKYNSYNGEIAPYIVEYPFAYKLQDEILQNIKDYSKIYKYNEDDTYIETNDVYFNKCILYNNQQSSGILKLEPKPYRNMSEVRKYPKYNADSKTITYTKSDNFYQINTFWSLVRDIKKPLFIKTCKSLSYDKEVNQENMNYGKLSFGKAPLRAKDLKVRLILDDRDDSRVVSQFIISPTITSYK